MDNSRIKIIANPEGFDLDKLFDIPDVTTNEVKIICGNLIDSCSESGCEFIQKKMFNNFSELENLIPFPTIIIGLFALAIFL
jgi:hypothetical protein